MIERQFTRIRGRVVPLWFTGHGLRPVFRGLYYVTSRRLVGVWTDK